MSVIGSGSLFFFLAPWRNVVPNCSSVTCFGPRIGCTFDQLHADALLSMSWNEIEFWIFTFDLKCLAVQSSCPAAFTVNHVLSDIKDKKKKKKFFILFFIFNVAQLHIFSFLILFIYLFFVLAQPTQLCCELAFTMSWGFMFRSIEVTAGRKYWPFTVRVFFVCLFPCTKIFDHRCKMAGRKKKLFSLILRESLTLNRPKQTQTWTKKPGCDILCE